jgi:hypothetical protein
MKNTNQYKQESLSNKQAAIVFTLIVIFGMLADSIANLI